MSRNSPSPKDDLTQLKQKLIHYKSEIRHVQNQLKSYERALEREKENTSFWKKKHAETLSTSEKEVEIEGLEKELDLLRNELSEQKIIAEAFREKASRKQPVIEEKIVEKVIEKIVEKPVERFEKSDILCFFQHSLLLPEQDESELMIFGNVIIQNQTSSTLRSPVLCLKMKPNASAILSGKIIDEKDIEVSSIPSASLEWRYAHPKWNEKIQNDGEYWIKPIKQTVLKPKDKLLFDSFQVVIPLSSDTTSFILEGFFYSEEWQEGIPFLNKVVLNFP
ncbi:MULTISPECIES: hypothetical protein [Priestia]|uniref:hypothetical protein n=1 Tax=Priestia TaxID=2800373 RepID=UPI0005ECA3B8|nr:MULTISPECIES: hypothetical protein [Priestia]KJL05059.1 hypothetical protein N178_09195 [Priestia aryabhattai B8W22]MBX4161158.1 hypothetical protein [Priestia megaterium]MED3895810.1 hypothetical protein [Priestia aryabhattai]